MEPTAELKPYYHDDFVTLYLGGCLTETHWLGADVLLTDPPYGIGYNSGHMRQVGFARSIQGDQDTSLRDKALDLWGRDRPALIFGSWKRPVPTGTRALLIWDTKGALGMGDLKIPWKPSHQQIYVVGRGFTGRRTSDVLTFAPVQSMAKNGRLHPHQKPLPLLLELISKCPDGVLADPFAGSGSTLVAAKIAGRKCIGVELEEKYCEIAAKRCEQTAYSPTSE